MNNVRETESQNKQKAEENKGECYKLHEWRTIKEKHCYYGSIDKGGQR